MQMVSMKAFVNALCSDPDLACIPETKRLYKPSNAATGCDNCDYTSFFTRLSKSSFLKALYQHAIFISSVKTTPGSLTNINDVESSTLVLITLVGTTYF